MERNTNDLRYIPEILAIAEYLQNMKFKHKMFGGVSTESVLDHFSQVTLQYEAIVSAYLAQCGEQTLQIAGLQGELERARQETAAGDAYCKRLAQWYEEAAARLREQNGQLRQLLEWQQFSQPMAAYTGAEEGRWAYAPQG